MVFGRHCGGAMATAAEDAIYRFEGFVLDIPRGILLTADGKATQLRYKSFELLRLFVENAGRLLDRDTIIQAVWSGAVVNPNFRLKISVRH